MSLSIRGASCVLLILAGVPAYGQTAADTLVKEGQTLLQHGDVDTAVQRFQAAAAANPQLYAAHYELGRALDLQGRYGPAREEFQHAIELAPDGAKNEPLAAMAISFAFEAKADEAARY